MGNGGGGEKLGRRKGELPLLTITILPSLISLTKFVSLPSHFCTWMSLSPSRLTTDLQFLSSAVISSNSSPKWKLISVFLNVLWVLITTLSPSWLMITVGLVTFPTCLVAKPTPKIAKGSNTVSCNFQNSSQSRNPLSYSGIQVLTVYFSFNPI